MLSLTNSKPSVLLFDYNFFIEATHLSIQQYSRKSIMCVHDVEHDFKYSVFKVVVYVKHEFTFFLVLKFFTGRWSVGRW